MRRPALCSATTLYVSLGIATAAHATSVTVPPSDPQPIYGGSEVEECGWPTTVYMDGCTGTLVHPEVVVFAAHCMFFAGGAGPSFAGFGEADGDFAREVGTSDCMMWPGWVPDESTFGFDVAFCTLTEPVIDVPIVPILMGCETEILQPGQGITLVGYGVTETGVFGTKHEVDTQVNGMEGLEINVGGGGTSSCNGDSGGPAYVQLEDGTWRVFGITSRGVTGNCNGQSIYGLIHSHVEWIEDETGIDITPCHDADGTWNPTDGCTEFPLDPGIADSGWEAGCGPGRLSGPSATCGDPFPFEEETSSTGAGGETGLDESGTGGSGGGTGLPGGTAGSATDPGDSDGGDTGTGAGTGGGDGSQDGDDQVITCTCSSNAPTPGWAWLLIPIVGVMRRRR